MIQPVMMSITATIMSMSKMSRVVLSFVVPSASIAITFSKGGTRLCVFPVFPVFLVFPGRPQGFCSWATARVLFLGDCESRPYILFCFHDIMTTQKDRW
jgi:hypothetical protein